MKPGMGMQMVQEQVLLSSDAPIMRQELQCLSTRLKLWANEEFVEGNNGSRVIVGRGLKATIDRLDTVG